MSRAKAHDPPVTFNVSGYEIASSGTGILDDNGGSLTFAATGPGQIDTTISATIGGMGDWVFDFDAAGSPANGNFILTGTNTRDGNIILNSPANDAFNSRTILRFSDASNLGVLSNQVTVNNKASLVSTADQTLAHTVNFSGGTIGVEAGTTLTIDDASLLSGATRSFGENFTQGTILLTDVAGAPTSGTTVIQSDLTVEVADVAALGDSNTNVQFQGGGGAQLLVTGTSTYTGRLIAERTSGESIVNVDSGITFTQTGDIAQEAGGNSSGKKPIFVKQGQGTLFIDRPTGITLPVETGTGGIRVDQGTLRVANSSGSATGGGYVRVMDGATLEAVDGSIIDPTNTTGTDDDTILILGDLSAGGSIGTLTIGNATDDDDVLQIAGNDGSTDFGGSLTIEFDGTSTDRVDVFGEIVLNLGLDSELILENFGSGALADTPYVFASYSTLSGTFDVITNNTGLTLDSSFGTGGIDYNYQSGNEIAVQFIPEPSTAMLALLGGFGLLVRRRRRA